MSDHEASQPHEERLLALPRPLSVDETAAIDCGFQVHASNVVAAISQTDLVLASLPMTLYQTIDLKAQSGIVGAVFATELAKEVGAVPNPIEKGHPDVVPVSAQTASEAELRNYPRGLEIKATVGGVVKGSELCAGEARIDCLANVVWQAHHRDVRALMGLVWDFVEGRASNLAYPSITGVFYSDELLEKDWGQIAGTTGRNTKVSGMKVSGRRKMAAGAIAVIDEPQHLASYAACLGVSSFSSLTTRTMRERL